jgi:hypothetical protein
VVKDNAEPWVPVETFAAKLTTKQLACRDNGHVWAPFTVRVLVSRNRVAGYERTMQCRQCRSKRRQLLNSTGGVVRNGYDYVDGYLADHVQKGFGREPFRLEAIHRFVDTHPDQVVNEEVEGHVE